MEGGAGMHLCRDLAAHMQARDMAAPEAGAVVNDTVATLLGGYLAEDRDAYDGFVGFILGTGLNCCYCEQGGRITKLAPGQRKDMVINMGGRQLYRAFPRGTLTGRWTPPPGTRAATPF